MTEIADAIKKLAGVDKLKITRSVAKVVSVELDNKTAICELVSSGIEVEVRLSAVNDPSSYFVVIPKIGSLILVDRVEGSDLDYSSSLYSEVDMIWVKCGSLKFNDGSNGGLVNIAPLVARLNKIEQVLASHQHTYATPVGPAITVPNGTQNAGITIINDLEDNKVIH